MSMVHEKLCQSQDLSRVGFRGYVTSITRYLYQSYNTQPEVIQPAIDIEDVSLDINIAMPCGLIINELLSNSFKHAFPRGKEGSINIALRSAPENKFELIMMDDGIGMPEEIDIATTDSVGLYLVFILVESQLHGEIKMHRTEELNSRSSFLLRNNF